MGLRYVMVLYDSQYGIRWRGRLLLMVYFVVCNVMYYTIQ